MYFALYELSLPLVCTGTSHCSQNTASPKVFLFDTSSKIHVATDTSPVDQATHNLCCDYLSMLNSVGPLYSPTSTPQQRHRSHLHAQGLRSRTTSSCHTSHCWHSFRRRCMICAVVCWSGMLCSLGRVLGRYENLACAEVRSHNLILDLQRCRVPYFLYHLIIGALEGHPSDSNAGCFNIFILILTTPA
ncbi:hypothetical protein BDR03DRAFT_85178 [Suillus americanus]|nr:hypothetical protein BDR03DRAFT_85178 [Suillus americanus]